MLNYITVQGRLTRDPELKTTGNGNHVTSFTVACQRNYQSNGERITDFIDCVAWRNVAERISKFWKKGRRSSYAEAWSPGSTQTGTATTGQPGK